MARRTWRQLLIVLPFIGLIYGPLFVIHNFYVFEAGCVLLAFVVSWYVYAPEPKRTRPAQTRAEPEGEPRFSRDPSVIQRPSARSVR